MEEGALPTIPPLQFGAPGGTVVQEDAQGGLLKEGHPMLPGDLPENAMGAQATAGLGICSWDMSYHQC